MTDPWAAFGLRRYRPQDRSAAHSVLRDQLGSGPVPYTIHPGDWDWWCFHHEPRVPPPIQLVGAGALVNVSWDGELCAFGLPATALGALCATSPGIRSVGYVSQRDGERAAVLRAGGWRPRGAPVLALEARTGTAREAALELPAGYTIRSLAGPAEATSRADAARLAFGSTLSPGQHRDRYRRFMDSPGYPDCLDLVAVAPDGGIAAFAVFWPDAATSTTQLEPAGTHPEHQRLGLGRAVVTAGLQLMAAAGLRLARVCTEQDRPAAPQLYARCGFTEADRLYWWHRDH